MNAQQKALVVGQAVVAALGMCMGCGGPNELQLGNFPKKVALVPQQVTLAAGQEQQFKIAATLDNGDVSELDAKSGDWRSTDPAVAAVSSSGKVKAISSGTTTITVKVLDLVATAGVTVTGGAAAPMVSATTARAAFGDTWAGSSEGVIGGTVNPEVTRVEIWIDGVYRGYAIPASQCGERAPEAEMNCWEEQLEAQEFANGEHLVEVKGAGQGQGAEVISTIRVGTPARRQR
jgi:hypothetical protein